MGYGSTNAMTLSGGGGSADYYKCASVNTANQTWTGYKAVLSGGIYTFESTATTGLEYTTVMPQVGWVYDAAALVKCHGLHGIVPSEYVFYDSLTSATGWEVSSNGASIVSDSLLGQNVFATSAGDGYFRRATPQNIPLGNAARTMSFWARKMGTVGTGWSGIGYGNDHAQGVRFTWGIRNDYPTISTWADDSWTYDKIEDYLQTIPDNNWHHWLLTANTSNLVSIYLDGQRVINFQIQYLDTQSGYIAIGDYAEESYAPDARFSSLRIYNRVLSAPDIYALAAEFSPASAS